jgi:hypothetical protein
MRNKRLEIEEAEHEFIETTLEDRKRLMEDILIRLKKIEQANLDGDVCLSLV